MSAPATDARGRSRPLLVPTVTKQCWGFMVGSAFFAIGSAPGLATLLGTTGANLSFFIGAWFFTAAGFMQLFLSGEVSVPVSYSPGRMVRAEWLTASTQSFGTILFNVSTTGALYAHTTAGQEHYSWNPDAGGSVAFLISGVFAFVAYSRVTPRWNLATRDWWSVFVNFVGCVAFGVSAVGAFILPGGNIVSTGLSSWGTFIGALCFLVASLVVLPQWNRHRDAIAA